MPSTRIRMEGPATIVAIEGRFDFSMTATLRDQLRDTVMAREPKTVIVDCRDIAFLDSSALGFLVGVHNSLAKQGGALRLFGIPAGLRRTFEQTTLAGMFSIYGTEEEALRA